MDKSMQENLVKDIRNIIDELAQYFTDKPELFLSEEEIRNELFRRLLHNLVHNNKFPVYVERESYQPEQKIKLDIAIFETNTGTLLFAFELKYTYSNEKALLQVIEKDVERIASLDEDSLLQGYVLFYNNFEMYPEKILESIRTIPSSRKTTILVNSLTRSKIKKIQTEYMSDYSAKFLVE